MRKHQINLKKWIFYLLPLLLFLCLFPYEVQAATPKINKKKETLYIGETTTLKVTGVQKGIKWTSSNKKVATVSSKGKVTAKAAGKSKITANVNGKKYTCTVTVKTPKLNKTKLTLYTGKTATLKLTGPKVTSWTSSNSKIATVNKKGKITAKKAGKVTITAKAAGKKYKCTVTIKVKAHTHNYKRTTITAPTCTSSGTYKYTCSICNQSYTKAANATGHNYTAKTKKPGCDEMGYTIYTCSNCKDSYYDNYTNSTGHNYTESIVAPTCSDMGYTIYTCGNCNDSYYTDYTYPTDHSYKEISRTESDCDTMGCITYQCEYCPETTFEYLPYAHDYAQRYVAPTCTSVGGTYEYCTLCNEGYFIGETEAKSDHDYTETVTEPTCTEMGYTTYQCKNCTANYIDDYTNCIDCEYERVTVSEPTCTRDGEILEICKHCKTENWTFSETIPALGHSYDGHFNGYERFIECQTCGHSFLSVSYTVADDIRSMVSMDEDGIHMMPGTKIALDINGIGSNYYYYEDLTTGVTNGETTIEIPISIPNIYHENDYIMLYENALEISSYECGTTQVFLYYEEELIDTIDIIIEGDNIIEATQKAIAGDTTAADAFPGDYRNLINVVADFISNNIDDTMTDAEKVETVCRWIIDYIEYDGPSKISKAHEAIATGKAVCSGYTHSFNFIMDVLEIPCYYVGGIGDYDAHAWNMVYIDTGNGKGTQWYYMDTTWGMLYCDFDTTVLEYNAAYGVGVWRSHEAHEAFMLSHGSYVAAGNATYCTDPELMPVK